MPNPLINHGGKIFAPSLLFLDEDNFPQVLGDAVLKAESDVISELEREEKIIEELVFFIKQLYEDAIMLRGSIPFDIQEDVRGHKPVRFSPMVVLILVVIVIFILMKAL